MSLPFNRRQFIGLAGAMPLFSMLSACDSGDDNQIINVGVTSRPRMLDPRKATDALSSRVNRLLYRQLIDFDDSFLPKPDLAQWQQTSPNTYVFSLISESFFTNGNKLTSEDVVATYQSILNPDFGSPHRGSLKDIESIKALDHKTVEFKLKEPDALFVGRLVIGILPKELVEQKHAFQQQPIGSGACEFVSLSEQKLVLKRRSDQVKLAFIPVKDATVRVLKLQKGELDIVQNDLSPELVQYCDEQSGLKVDWHGGTNFGYIGFNFEDPILAQPQVRQAIAHGIDRQAIVEAIFSGHARLAGGLLVPEHWAGVKAMPGYEYNPQKAKSLLNKADFSGVSGAEVTKNSQGDVQIALSYKTSNDPTRIRLATIYQAQLKKIGIHLNVQSYDWGTFYNDIKKGRFQLYSLAWVGVKSPDIFQYVFDSNAIPPSGANRGRYRSEDADILIKQAGAAKTIVEQAGFYRELQSLLQSDLAAMPLWYEDQYSVVRKNVNGYQLFADGRLDGLLNVDKTSL